MSIIIPLHHPRHLPLGDKRLLERAMLASDMSIANPSGFRRMSARSTAPGFVEGRYIDAGLMKPDNKVWMSRRSLQRQLDNKAFRDKMAGMRDGKPDAQRRADFIAGRPRV